MITLINSIWDAEVVNMDYYQNNANEYINKTKNADLSKERNELLKTLPNKGKILDIGFGSGRDSLAFKEVGYDVISIDTCSEFVNMANR